MNELPEQVAAMWYERAVLEEPRGAVCSYCGKENRFCDDMGWFYLPEPVCEECWRGEVGDAHRAIYGTGDR